VRKAIDNVRVILNTIHLSLFTASLRRLFRSFIHRIWPLWGLVIVKNKLTSVFYCLLDCDNATVRNLFDLCLTLKTKTLKSFYQFEEKSSKNSKIKVSFRTLRRLQMQIWIDRDAFCLWNHSYENVFRLQVHFYANKTHLHLKGFARGFVFKQNSTTQ